MRMRENLSWTEGKCGPCNQRGGGVYITTMETGGMNDGLHGPFKLRMKAQSSVLVMPNRYNYVKIYKYIYFHTHIFIYQSFDMTNNDSTSIFQ